VASAEAAALLEGFKLATKMGRNNILIRMENIIVVQVLKEDEGYSMMQQHFYLHLVVSW
jgi:hypothetical protein